jgi:hypothetical protein
MLLMLRSALTRTGAGEAGSEQERSLGRHLFLLDAPASHQHVHDTVAPWRAIPREREVRRGG